MTRPHGIIFDLDGTVYRGEQLIPGAHETIERMRERAHPLVFVTNAIETVAEHVDKLARLGIAVQPDQVITAARVLVHLLHQTMPGARVFALADPVLIEQLAPHFQLTENPAEIDVVVASTDRAFDYRKLTIGFRALKRGARFWATNADATWPQDGDEIPDAGAMIGALEGCTHRKVELIAGKPSRHIAEFALARLGCDASECVIVGDSLASDIAMGKQSGMKTILVLTGVTRQEDLVKARIQPDVVCPSIAEIPDGLLKMGTG